MPASGTHLRGGELEEDVVLQLLHLDLEAVLLLHQPLAQLRQIAPLLAHHQTEHLVLQALLRDREVHQSRLGLDLGRVVRVGQLGVQEQTEVAMELNLERSDTETDSSILASR